MTVRAAKKDRGVQKLEELNERGVNQTTDQDVLQHPIHYTSLLSVHYFIYFMMFKSTMSDNITLVVSLPNSSN